MKYIEILTNNLSKIQEARVPGLPYKEEPVSKTNPVIDRVILTLEAKDSELMTKIALKYKKLDNIQKAIDKRRNEMNTKVKEKMSELFDAEDVWRTRVIETISATMTLAKRSEGTAAKPEEHIVVVDYEKVSKELLSLMEGELLKAGASILLKYTKFETLPAIPAQEPKSPSLLVKPKTNKAQDAVRAESINESINWKSIKEWLHSYYESFLQWGLNYDKKLNKIKEQLS